MSNFKNFDFFNFLNDEKPESVPRSDNSFIRQDDPHFTPNSHQFHQPLDEEEPVITAIRPKNSRQGRRIAGERPLTAPSAKDPPFGIVRPANTAKETEFSSIRPLSPVKEELKGSVFKTFQSSEENFQMKESQNFRPEPVQTGRFMGLNQRKEEKIERLTPRSLKMKTLQEELAKVEEERKSTLAEQKERFEKELEQDLEMIEKEHEAKMMELKQAFELKKYSLQSYKEHADKVAGLAQMITRQSQTVNILNSKFSKEKEFLEDIKNQELLARERALENRESRLMTQLQSLDQSKLTLLHKQKQLEEIEERLQREVESEKEKLAEEQRTMSDLKDMLRQKDREKKNFLAIEMHKLELLQDQVEREEKLIEEEIKLKENEISEKLILMDQEKNEAYSCIQFEKNYLNSQISQLEAFRRNIPVLDSDLNKRAAACDEKSKQVLVESENLRKAQEMLERDQVLFEKEGQKIHQICIEIEKESEALSELREELDRKRQEIDLKRQEVISIKELSRNDLQRVEQLKQSVYQRKRVYESLKTPIKEIEFPKYDTPPEYEVEPPRPVSSYTRPRSVVSRNTFKASDYLKELEPYAKVRDDIKNYIHTEGNRLMQSKLDYETGIHKNFKNGFHEFSLPSSSNRRQLESLNFKTTSFARGDSNFFLSGLTDQSRGYL